MQKRSRANDELRPLSIARNYLKYPEGSALITLGDTMVICTASVEEKVPPFLHGSGQGWVTAEYAMLPRATGERTGRERGGASARSLEIQRLIGRSLRAVTDLSSMGEITIRIDCDVLQADGGTRTAAISGGFTALAEALSKLQLEGRLEKIPLTEFLSAVSVGIVEGSLLLDLAYEEDSTAAVDMNVVMTASSKLVEVQGSAEREPFSRNQLNRLLDLAEAGISRITECQKAALGPLISGQIGSASPEKE